VAPALSEPQGGPELFLTLAGPASRHSGPTCRGGVFNTVLHLVRQHSVEHDAAQRHALLREHLPVHLELVERLADPAVGDEHHVSAAKRCSLSIRELDDAAHPHVAGPLDEHRVAHCVLRFEGLSYRRDLRQREPARVSKR
jgi:hypothetical protein